MEYEIIHQPDQSLFKTIIDGRTAFAQYRIINDGFDIIHTIVPKPLEGKGIAAALVSAAYNYGASQGFHPLATCSYAAVWLKRHPDFHKKSDDK